MKHLETQITEFIALPAGYFNYFEEADGRVFRQTCPGVLVVKETWTNEDGTNGAQTSWRYADSDLGDATETDNYAGTYTETFWEEVEGSN